MNVVCHRFCGLADGAERLLLLHCLLAQAIPLLFGRTCCGGLLLALKPLHEFHEQRGIFALASGGDLLEL